MSGIALAILDFCIHKVVVAFHCMCSISKHEKRFNSREKGVNIYLPCLMLAACSEV